MKEHIKPCNCKTCLDAKNKELEEQVEVAEDYFASVLADIVNDLKKAQILADKEQALETDIFLQELIIKSKL